MEINVEAIQNAVELAGNAGGSAKKIAQAADVFANLFRKSKVGTNADVEDALSTLRLEIANARHTNADLLVQLVDLEKALREAKALQSDLDRYELSETKAGHFVYALKQGREEGEPRHFLCAKCVSDRYKSILQGDTVAKKCPSCSTVFQFDEKPNKGLAGSAYTG